MNAAWQPNGLHEQLLEACLTPGARGDQALRAWQAAVDLQTLDGSSYRLLPLLAARLDAPGIEPEFRGLIKGVYRRTWYHNQLLLAQGRQLAAQLAARGIPVMVLKGAALMLRHYRDVGARPMNDLDLAVPTEHAQPAVKYLLETGWQPGPEGTGWTRARRPRPLEGFNPCYLGSRHAHGFRNASGIGVDLHWHVFQRQCDPSADGPSWAAAIRISAEPAALWTLCDPEHLLLILGHGSSYNRIPSIRWVADAVTLLGATPGFDWEGFVAVARQRRLTLPAAALLTYLDGRFAVRVPAGVLERLRHEPVSRSIQRAYRRAVSPPPRLARFRELRYAYGRYRALRAISPATCPPGFLAFLGRVWDADSPWQILRCLGPSGWGRLRGMRSTRGRPAAGVPRRGAGAGASDARAVPDPRTGVATPQAPPASTGRPLG